MQIQNINIEDFESEGVRVLQCNESEDDYNFIKGKIYKVHYDNNKGAYIYGTTGFFGNSDSTYLIQLTQEILNKFSIIG